MAACIQGDLEPENDRLCREHVNSCPQCKKEWEAYEKSWQALELWEDIEPSPSFLADFWKKAEEGEEKQSPWEAWIGRLAGAFTFRVPAWAAMAVLLVSLFTGHFAFPRVEERVVQKPVENIKVVYVQAPQEIAVAASNISVDKAVVPDPVEVVDEIQQTTTAEEYPKVPDNLGEDGGIDRVNLDDLLQDVGS